MRTRQSPGAAEQQGGAKVGQTLLRCSPGPGSVSLRGRVAIRVLPLELLLQPVCPQEVVRIWPDASYGRCLLDLHLNCRNHSEYHKAQVRAHGPVEESGVATPLALVEMVLPKVAQAAD